ncbi:hypothetical protein JM78_19885 [Burkholderia pyrrocinia]|nr:hypothetical protein JM78_19885 [Burkholderia pyrrocinia]
MADASIRILPPFEFSVNCLMPSLPLPTNDAAGSRASSMNSFRSCRSAAFAWKIALKAVFGGRLKLPSRFDDGWKPG